jgi:hypothetical protein
MRIWLSLGLWAALLGAAGGTEAQEYDRGPRGFLDLTFLAANPTGEFGQLVDDGFGVELSGGFAIDPLGILNLRTDFGFINYGRERIQLCSSFSCRVGTQLSTWNNIVFAGIGPELSMPVGPIRPYVGGTVGVGYFFTTSGFDDRYYDYGGYSTTNFDDVVLQLRGVGGVKLRIAGGRTPVYLDFGAEYHHNGIAEWLREGDIEDRPDGSIVIYPNRSDANLWTVRVGLSIGFGARSDTHPPRRRRGRSGRPVS